MCHPIFPVILAAYLLLKLPAAISLSLTSGLDNKTVAPNLPTIIRTAKCIETSEYIRFGANTPDCVNALLQLPQKTEPNLFVLGSNPFDPYQLPKIVKAGQCTVEVNLRPGIRLDQSSWIYINLDARSLASGCARPLGYLQVLLTGGTIATGGAGNIVVILSKH